MSLALLINDQGEARPTWQAIAAALARAERGEPPIVVRVRERRDQPFRSTVGGRRYYAVGLLSLPGHSLLAALQLAWIFRKERVRLAHLHLAYWDAWGFWLYSLLGRTPFVVTFHSWNPGRAARANRWLGEALRLLLRRAGRVTAVSRAAAEDLRAWLPEVEPKLRVVPNGVEPAPAPRALPRAAPERFVLWAGSLFFQKGADVLLFALHDLARSGLRVPAVVCGEDLTEGGLVADLARRLGLAGSVEFWGPRAREEVRELMRRCQAFVSPSRGESCSLALLEAMAAGKPVVAPEVGGVGELVEDGVTGLLYPRGDAVALGRAIARLWDDAPLRASLGRGAARASARRSWGSVSEAYRGVLEEARSSGRPRA